MRHPRQEVTTRSYPHVAPMALVSAQNSATTVQSRGGSGIIAIKSDKVAGALSVAEEDEIMMFTKKGQAVRKLINTVRVTGRAAAVSSHQLVEKDELIGISKVTASEEEQSGEEKAANILSI